MQEAKKNVKGRLVSFARRNKIISAVILAIILAVLTASSIQLALYINFITGNDIVIDLIANRTDFFLVHGQHEKINFEIQASANPFCRIECESSFLYISGNETPETETFHLRPQIARKKEYRISASRLGTGQELYRFGVACRNVKSFLCHTNERETTRSVLITVEHGLNGGEKALKQDLRQQLEAYSEIFGNLNASLVYLENEIESINNTLILPEAAPKFKDAGKQGGKAADYFSRAEELWEKQDYAVLEKNVVMLESSLINFQEIHAELRDAIYSNISFYNMLVENLTITNQSLASLAELEFNQSYLEEAEKIINDFNQNISLFESAKTLKEKEAIAERLQYIGISRFYSVPYGNETKGRTNKTVEFNIKKINLSEPAGSFALHLMEQPAECCVFGKCGECCNGCNEKYPIIFLHGHDFNREISAYYSLNAFGELQKALENDGYLNAGEISLLTARRDNPGILGMSGMPITARASYYLDVFFSKLGRYIQVQAKGGNIDTYAIRLKELIDNIKYETNQSKVIVIAHSMGGLVARRYLQIFRDSGIEKLVLVNVPNKGITGKIKQYCPFLGSSIECRDMDSESLFINKLNAGTSEKIKIYNIIGSGCQMDEGMGDGIVLEENALLENASNYIIKGQCSGINLLHGELLDISKYPEFYRLVKEILKQP